MRTKVTKEWFEERFGTGGFVYENTDYGMRIRLEELPEHIAFAEVRLVENSDGVEYWYGVTMIITAKNVCARTAGCHIEDNTSATFESELVYMVMLRTILMVDIAQTMNLFVDFAFNGNNNL